MILSVRESLLLDFLDSDVNPNLANGHGVRMGVAAYYASERDRRRAVTAIDNRDQQTYFDEFCPPSLLPEADG